MCLHTNYLLADEFAQNQTRHFSHIIQQIVESAHIECPAAIHAGTAFPYFTPTPPTPRHGADLLPAYSQYIELRHAIQTRLENYNWLHRNGIRVHNAWLPRSNQQPAARIQWATGVQQINLKQLPHKHFVKINKSHTFTSALRCVLCGMQFGFSNVSTQK